MINHYALQELTHRNYHFFILTQLSVYIGTPEVVALPESSCSILKKLRFFINEPKVPLEKAPDEAIFGRAFIIDC